VLLLRQLRPRRSCASSITALTDQILHAVIEVTGARINIVPEMEAPEVVFGHGLLHGAEPEGEVGEGRGG
jgi:hypothetical protein